MDQKLKGRLQAVAIILIAAIVATLGPKMIHKIVHEKYGEKAEAMYSPQKKAAVSMISDGFQTKSIEQQLRSAPNRSCLITKAGDVAVIEHVAGYPDLFYEYKSVGVPAGDAVNINILIDITDRVVTPDQVILYGVKSARFINQ